MPVLVATLQQGELPAGCLALQHLPFHHPPPAGGFLLQRKQLPWGRKGSLFFSQLCQEKEQLWRGHHRSQPGSVLLAVGAGSLNNTARVARGKGPPLRCWQPPGMQLYSYF